MAKPKRSQRQTATRTGNGARSAGANTRAAPAGTGATAANDRTDRTAPAANTRTAPAANTRTAPATNTRTARVGSPPRRRLTTRPWWQGRTSIIATLVSVALIVVFFIVLSGRGNGSGTSAAQPAPASVVQGVTQVSPEVFSTVGTAGLSNPLQATHETAILKGPSGKPLFLYVGAEYCPYCAAERWSMIVALSRFGTFSNLHLTTSAGDPEVYPNTPTFTFYGSSYTSQYLEFQSVELNTNQPSGLSGYGSLQKLTNAQQQLFDKYDAPPYTQQAGGIPFLDVGNQYIEISSGFLPSVLAGQSWEQIASAMSNPQAPTTKAIVGNANYLTAALCQITNNQPASVCAAAPIPAIQQSMAKGK
jgi:hypothetical protein